VVLVAGVLAVGLAVLVVLRGRSWPGMGRRYERGAGAGAGAGHPNPTATGGTDEERTQAAWRALDRGEDPTDAVADPRPAPGPDAPGGGVH
jgi:hypothetical protein